MQIQRTLHEDVAVLAVDGRLDATTAPAFENALLAEVGAGVTRVVVDLGQVQLISSAALRVLVSAAKLAKKGGGQILLCALTPEVAKVFGISGLASLFKLQPTREEAFAALGVAAVEPPPAAPEPTPMDDATVQPEVAPTPAPAPEEDAPTIAPAPKPTLAPAPKEAATVMPVARVMPPPPVAAAPPPERMVPPPVWLPPLTVAPMRPGPTPDGWLGQPRLMWIGAGALALFCVLVASLLLSSRGAKPRQRVSSPRAAASATPAASVTGDAVPTPAATEEQMPTAVIATNASTPVPPPPAAPPTDAAAAAVSVPPADTHRFDTQSAENQETRQAVLRRIDAMPILPAQRDRLYQELDRARGLGKIITIRFGAGRSDLNNAAVDDLKAALRRPDLKTLLDDPSTVFVVLGFADATGTVQANKETSQRRAERTLTALRDQCGMLNVLHAIGMGSSGLLDQEHLEKNRVAEVWAVLP